jgi:hypothetical protein
VSSAKGTGSGSSSCSVTVSPTAGNALIVWLTSTGGNSANYTVSDNIDGTTGWNKITFTTTKVACFWKTSIPSGITTLTCNAGSGATYATAVSHEVSGLVSTPFTTGENLGTNSTQTANPVTSSLTNATADSIFFAALSNASGSNPATSTILSTGTVGTWIEATNGANRNGSTSTVLSTVYQIVSTSSARAHGWTTEELSNQAKCIVAFHA